MATHSTDVQRWWYQMVSGDPIEAVSQVQSQVAARRPISYIHGTEILRYSSLLVVLICYRLPGFITVSTSSYSK